MGRASSTHWPAMLKLFRKSGKSEDKEKVPPAIQPIPAPRKSVPTVTKKPEKSSPVLANRSPAPAPGPGKEVTKEVIRRRDEKVGERDFLLTEMQALLDPLQSGKVKGEELRHILASIGNRSLIKMVWMMDIYISALHCLNLPVVDLDQVHLSHPDPSSQLAGAP